MTLRDRCQEIMMLGELNADVLFAFVVAEIGRNASEKFDDSVPLCLYFPTKRDREEFMALVQEEKPNWTMRRMP